MDAERGIKLAVAEINANDGVNVAGVMRPFKVEVMDTRDLEPGVPVSESLLVVEKLILEKKVDFIVGGPVRSEAALGVMDILSKHKTVSILSAGVLSPTYHARVAEDYDKYKYSFRTTGSIVPMIGEVIETLELIRAEKGFDRIFIMVQDVAHARAAGDSIKAGLLPRAQAPREARETSEKKFALDRLVAGGQVSQAEADSLISGLKKIPTPSGAAERESDYAAARRRIGEGTAIKADSIKVGELPRATKPTEQFTKLSWKLSPEYIDTPIGKAYIKEQLEGKSVEDKLKIWRDLQKSSTNAPLEPDVITNQDLYDRAVYEIDKILGKTPATGKKKTIPWEK